MKYYTCCVNLHYLCSKDETKSNLDVFEYSLQYQMKQVDCLLEMGQYCDASMYHNT